MSEYISYDSVQVNLSNMQQIRQYYDQGFVFTRIRGRMDLVRSVRINLKNFELSSENRRILRKFAHNLQSNPIPLKKYSWQIGKLAKDFYDTKFGENTFSANKIKELLVQDDQNFNTLINYDYGNKTDGYVICYFDREILHYSYPFYSTELVNTSFGMYMMTKAIEYAKQKGLEYIYLGSLHSKASLYKLQFKGLEWFDPEKCSWGTDIDKAKKLFND